MSLNRHVETLLGLPAGKRSAPVMVSMPSEAATDPALVRDLLAAGMDDSADEVEASWSRDGKWVYFGSNKSGRFELYKMPAAGGTPARVTGGGGVREIESVDGKWVYFAKDGFSPTSIWKAPMVGGQEMFVLDHVASSMSFDVTTNAIHFVAVDDGSKQTAIKTFNLASGALTTMRRLEKPWGYGLAISRDQRSLLYSEVDEAGSDLTLAINFHRERK